MQNVIHRADYIKLLGIIVQSLYKEQALIGTGLNRSDRVLCH